MTKAREQKVASRSPASHKFAANKAGKASAESNVYGEILSTQRPKIRWTNALWFIAIGLALTAALVALKLGFEATYFGARVEKQAYALLTSALPKFRPRGVEVTVLDISHLALGAEVPVTGHLVPTPRSELLALIEAVVALRPKAIGVDVDFSPTPNGWVDDADPIFFAKCMELSESVPIVLGIFRSLREPRSAWLGASQFAPLAGGMWLPEAALERAPITTQSPGIPDRLPSLGAALARATTAFTETTSLTSWRQRFRERSSRREDGLTIEEVLMDYSAVGQIKRERIRITSIEQLHIHRASIEGRIVVFGNVERALDRFAVPGEDREIPGVIVHAAVANTLTKEPIWELTHNARLAIDILLSVLVLVVAALLGVRVRSNAHTTIESYEGKVVCWLVAATLIGGLIAVVWLRILWLDFILVALSLLLHSWLSRKFHQHSLSRAERLSAAKSTA